MTRFAFVVAALLAGCAGPEEEGDHFIPAPSRESFPRAADALGSHCGSLDCHGSVARNLRIYSLNGLRIGEVTGTHSTTDEEYAATYQSVVLLEPEKFGQVIVEGGRGPERLTIVRKGRGTEHHKGGAQAPAGSDADRCFLSWLAQAVDETACGNAAEVPTPEF